jgi:hypothetical protein
VQHTLGKNYLSITQNSTDEDVDNVAQLEHIMHGRIFAE